MDIYQVSLLIPKQKVISQGLFNDIKVNKETKYRILFDAIQSKAVSSDNEAIKLLGYEDKVSSFKKFKQRYTNKLIDYLILLDHDKTSLDAINYDYYIMLKKYCAAKILHHKQLKGSAMSLYNQVVNIARKYGYYDIMISCLREIKKHHAYIIPNQKQFEISSDQMNIALSALNKQIQLSELYDKTSYDYFNSNRFNNKSERLDIHQKVSELFNQSEQEDSFLYTHELYQLLVFTLNLNDKVNESIEIGKQTIQMMETKNIDSKSSVYLAYNGILQGFLKLKEYDKALEYVDKILDLFTKVSYNYFRFKSLEFSVYAVIFNYDRMYRLTQTALKEKKLNNYPAFLEEWKIRQAFLYILVYVDKIDSVHLDEMPLKPFRYNKFANEVEHFSKDKRGKNITIIVIQLLHLLMAKKYDKIIDRLDALNQYSFRYLRNDDTLRSNCFIKMLLKLPEAEYHPIRTQRYVAKYEKKLKENPLELNQRSIDLEIIPYEQLWEITMEILEKNKK